VSAGAFVMGKKRVATCVLTFNMLQYNSIVYCYDLQMSFQEYYYEENYKNFIPCVIGSSDSACILGVF
jgi:hypothetical protein